VKKDHARFVEYLLSVTEVGDDISSAGAIDLVMTHLEVGDVGRYHSTLFMPSRNQVGWIMSVTKQFEKIETNRSALWRRIA
jgi:hypothetical protein